MLANSEPKCHELDTIQSSGRGRKDNGHNGYHVTTVAWPPSDRIIIIISPPWNHTDFYLTFWSQMKPHWFLSHFLKHEVTLKSPCQKQPKCGDLDLEQLSQSSSRYNEWCSTVLRRPISALPRDSECKRERERERERKWERERRAGGSTFFFPPDKIGRLFSLSSVSTSSALLDAMETVWTQRQLRGKTNKENTRQLAPIIGTGVCVSA